ncbi:MAG: lysylphosphatidylglycerol synthase transmembrane domain-containing protein [Acidimicrobiales bacterium]
MRAGVVLTMVGLAAASLPGLGQQVGEALRQLADLRWGWVGVAAVAEGASMVFFAVTYQQLLGAGGVRVGLARMTAITFAANAVSTSLPGGPAWATAWSFGQLRREGADRVLAGWVVVVGGAVASFTLFLVMGAGTELAGASGPLAGLRWLPVALVAIPVLVALPVVLARRWGPLRRGLAPLARRLQDNLAATTGLASRLGRLLVRLGEVRPGASCWAKAGGAALANWLTECVCLAAAVWAVGGDISWGAVLVVYGVSQVGVSLPLAPGGLGVVEASTSLLLIAYGVPAPMALAAVVLFRVVTLWALLPLGWGAWAALELSSRRRVRSAERTPTARELAEQDRPSPDCVEGRERAGRSRKQVGPMSADGHPSSTPSDVPGRSPSLG